MKKILFSLFLILFNPFAFSKSEHRQHHAHVHGGGQLAIAFDGLNGQIEFKSSADSILGFESIPKTESQQKIVAEAESIFKDKISQFIKFDTLSQCQLTPNKIGQFFGSKTKKHSDWIATYSVKCQKSLIKTQVTFDFTTYKNITDLDITLLIDSLQKSAEYKGQSLTVDIK